MSEALNPPPVSEPYLSPATTITAIMVSVVLLGSGGALQGSIISLRAGMEGFSGQMIGLIMSGYYIGFMIGSFVVVPFMRAVGYVRTFAAFASLSSTIALAHLLVIHPVAWFLFRTLHGLFLACMLVVIESWLNISSSSYNRGRVLALYSLVYLGAMGAGQPLLGIFSPSRFEIFAITSILISLSLVPLALTQVSGAPAVDRAPIHLWGTFKKAPLAAFGVIIAGMTTEAMWGMGPRFGQLVGLSEARIGTLLLCLSLGSLSAQWPLGWFSDHRDRLTAILVAAAMSGISAAGIAFTHGTGILLYVLAFFFGAFCMPLYSLCLSLINDQLDHREMVQAASALILFYGVGASIGPSAAGLTMSRLGPLGLFVFLGTALGVFVVLGLGKAMRSAVRFAGTAGIPDTESVQDSEHAENYRPYPRTTFAAFAMLLRPVRRTARRAEKRAGKGISTPPEGGGQDHGKLGKS
jgi:MFS family permease